MPPAARGEATSNIVETAVAAGNFTTLVAALQATGLDAVLANESNTYTVFAPTDAAFAMLGGQTINTLLANPDVLSTILLQHVVEGEVDSVTAYTLNGKQATSASGAMLDHHDQRRVGPADHRRHHCLKQGISTRPTALFMSFDAVYIGDVQVPAAATSVVGCCCGQWQFQYFGGGVASHRVGQCAGKPGWQFYRVLPQPIPLFAALGEQAILDLLADPQKLADILFVSRHQRCQSRPTRRTGRCPICTTQGHHGQ